MYFKFNYFDTEKDHDILEFNDGSKIKLFSGSNMKDVFVSRSKFVSFKFTSDDNMELRGFNISYETAQTGWYK